MENQLIVSNTFYKSWHEAMKKLTPEQYGKLAFALNEYCFLNIMPNDLEFPLDVLFTSFLPSINASKTRKLAGRKGGSRGKGGAPVGNQNAVKQQQKQQESNRETTEKQPRIEDENNLTVNDKDENSNSLQDKDLSKQQNQNNSKTIAEQQQNNTNVNVNGKEKEKEKMNDDVMDTVHSSSSLNYLIVLGLAKKAGFSLYGQQAQDFLNNVDNTWFEGEYNFIAYAAERVRNSGFPKENHEKMFVSSWRQDFITNSFLDWRTEQIAEQAKRATEAETETEYNNRPLLCSCGSSELVERSPDEWLCLGCKSREIKFKDGRWVEEAA